MGQGAAVYFQAGGEVNSGDHLIYFQMSSFSVLIYTPSTVYYKPRVDLCL